MRKKNGAKAFHSIKKIFVIAERIHTLTMFKLQS